MGKVQNTQGGGVLTEYLDGGRGDGLAVRVPGVAGVHTAVLRVHRQQVQGHVVKVIGRPETMTCKQKQPVCCIYKSIEFGPGS